MKRISKEERNKIVKQIKDKTLDAIKQYKQHSINKKYISDDFYRKDVLLDIAVLALEDYINNDGLIQTNQYGTYILDDNVLGVLNEDKDGLLSRLLYYIVYSNYNAAFYIKQLLTDRFVDNELVTIIERCIYKKKHDNEQTTTN